MSPAVRLECVEERGLCRVRRRRTVLLGGLGVGGQIEPQRRTRGVKSATRRIVAEEGNGAGG